MPLACAVAPLGLLYWLKAGSVRSAPPAAERFDEVIVVIWLVVIDDWLSSSDRSARFSVVSAPVWIDPPFLASRTESPAASDSSVPSFERSMMLPVPSAVKAVLPAGVARQLAEIHLAARLRVDVEAAVSRAAGQGRQVRQVENRASAAGLRRGAVGVAVLVNAGSVRSAPPAAERFDEVIVVIWLVVIDDWLSSSDRSARFSVVSAGLDRSAVLGLEDRIAGGVRQQRTELREVDDAARAVRGEGRPPGRCSSSAC